MNVNASLTNVTVVGFGNSQILLNTVDPVKYDFYTKLRLPKIRIEGNYNLLGRILLIPLRGKGKCWFEASMLHFGFGNDFWIYCWFFLNFLEDLDIAVNSDVDLYNKDSFKFYNVTGVHVKYSIGGLKLYMGNLFDGIKSLGEIILFKKFWSLTTICFLQKKQRTRTWTPTGGQFRNRSIQSWSKQSKT